MIDWDNIKEPKEAGHMAGKPLTVSNDRALDSYFEKLGKRGKRVKKHVARKKSAKKA